MRWVAARRYSVGHLDQKKFDWQAAPIRWPKLNRLLPGKPGICTKMLPILCRILIIDEGCARRRGNRRAHYVLGPLCRGQAVVPCVFYIRITQFLLRRE